MKFSKYILALALGLASLSSFATDATITKSVSPGSSSVVPTATLAIMSMYYGDFPSGTSSATKTITSIDWSTTHYPNNPGETVELCYTRPNQSNPIACMNVLPNSSQTGVTSFNSYLFGNGAQFMFRHKLPAGGTKPALPATGGVDTIVIRYSY